MARLRLDDGDVGSTLARACRKLEPDEAAADDGDAASRQEMVADAQRIAKGAQIGHALAGRFGKRQPPWHRARRQQQSVVGQRHAIGEADGFRAGVDRYRAFSRDAGDALLGENLGRRNPFRQRRIGERQHVLRQRWPLVRMMRLVADQRHRPVIAVFAQRKGRACTAFAGADDDHARVGAHVRRAR
jgi:hypothetical protein